MDENINKYYNEIKKNKPEFIETKNSYERLCLYKALEKYGKEEMQVWYHRKKEYVDMYCKGYMCKKHKCKLSRCDDYEGDFFCDECYYYKQRLCAVGMIDDECVDEHCMDLGEEGDFLYKSRITIGVKNYYTNPNLKKIKTAC